MHQSCKVESSALRLVLPRVCWNTFVFLLPKAWVLSMGEIRKDLLSSPVYYKGVCRSWVQMCPITFALFIPRGLPVMMHWQFGNPVVGFPVPGYAELYVWVHSYINKQLRAQIVDEVGFKFVDILNICVWFYTMPTSSYCINTTM